MRSPPPPAEPTPELQPVDTRYEYTQGLPALLEQLELSVLLSTYQTMGLCRTARGIAVGTRDGIWSLPASREIAHNTQPEGEHDIAFLARSCHHSGPLLGHDLAWGGDEVFAAYELQGMPIKKLTRPGNLTDSAQTTYLGPPVLTG